MRKRCNELTTIQKAKERSRREKKEKKRVKAREGER
jgi:hypothetical protein